MFISNLEVDMSIRNKGTNTWGVRVRCRVNGTEVSKKETVYGTKSDALIVEAKLRQELLQIKKTQASSLTADTGKFRTFGEAIDFYLERNTRTISRNLHIFRMLKKGLGKCRVSELGNRFDRYLLHLRHEKRDKTGRKYSNASINRVLAYAKSVCNMALRFEKIDKNPLNRFSKLKEVPRDRVLSAQEEQRLLNVLREDAPHVYPAVLFALQIPIRKSELVNMRTSDLDLINNVVRLRNGTTKNSRGCYIPIPPDMTEYFRSIPSGCDYVFYRKVSEGYRSLGDFKISWRNALRKAGIEDFRFHDLRHISATRLVDAGTPERIVREIANWQTDMLNRYYHMNSSKIYEAVRFGNDKVAAPGCGTAAPQRAQNPYL